MLRANRMKPSGSASRKNARSSALSDGPAQPKIVAFTGGKSPRRRDDDAIGLAGLECAADALRLLFVEQAGLDAVPHALVGEIDLCRLHAQVGQYVAVRGLQLGPSRLGDVLALGRGELDPPAAARARHA